MNSFVTAYSAHLSLDHKTLVVTETISFKHCMKNITFRLQTGQLDQFLYTSKYFDKYCSLSFQSIGWTQYPVLLLILSNFRTWMRISICSICDCAANVHQEKTGISNSCNNEWSPLGSFYFLPTFSIFNQPLWMEGSNANNRSICSSWMCIWTHAGASKEFSTKQVISRFTKAEWYRLNRDLPYGKNERTYNAKYGQENTRNYPVETENHFWCISL